MLFAPVRLGSTALSAEVLTADVKNCKHFGPCGVGEKALYLNGFLFDRHYYVVLGDIRRVFKRVAMSKGGFTGKGAFGSIPYLGVELDDGSQKQCNFKHEEDVDLLLAHMARVCPDIPRHSVEAERRLREKAEREAKRYLKQLTPQAQAARETLEQAQQLQNMSQSTNTQLIWIASISLLVGGIGVMNIMLVSVTERTSEIGLKKAIGAKKRSILTQFLTEAVVLTSLGGLLGVIVGIILAEVISYVTTMPVAISIPAAVGSVLFSMVIGIVFGVFPSYKAANLNPIDALRHE